jgi:all-trans-8'-apo-beta-carotenal 15,15'-oxygenase
MNAIPGNNAYPSCHGGLENLDQEYDYEVTEIEGAVPTDLKGTFFRNGPGRQRIGDTSYGHWFDGDGMISAFTFSEGRVHFKNRYVRTPKYLAETAAQSICFRGFGTQVPGGLRKNFLKMPANPANTSLIHHGGHLLALNEGGRPWALDPGSLETLGEFSYEGGLKPGQVFSAHGKIHTRSGDYINFGAGISGFGLKGPKPCLNIYRINPSGKLFKNKQVPLDAFPFCHDFALSDRYAIFFLGSIVFGNMLPVVLGARTISDQVIFDPSIAMRIIVLDLEDFSLVRSFETDPGAIIHFGNAFESGDELIVDGMFQDNFEANDTLKDVFNPEGRFGGGFYYRYYLNMATGAMRAEQVVPTESEFPTINPSYAGIRNRYTYTACSVDNGADSFFNGIAKVDFEGNAETLTLPPGYYGSEPVFAPTDTSKDEDDGYVLEVVYNGFDHVSELQIHRAKSLSDCVCRLRLPHHLPHQFHGLFSPQVF